MKRLILPWLILLINGAGVSAQQLSTLPDVSGVTGAVVDERAISNVYYVNAQRGNNRNGGQSADDALLTIFAAKDKALADLKNGIPTKILIAGGTYRESLGRVDFGEGPGKDALFVIEGTPGEEVIISGSQVFTDWTSAGNNLYQHPWGNDWGNLWVYDQFVEATLLAHRSEMIFVDGEPLRQAILEDYEETNDRYTNYIGYNDPAQTLTPGTFGVAERDENGNQLFIRPTEGVDPVTAQIEVAVQRQFGSFSAKNGLVLRNLTVQHFANTIGPGYDFQYAVAVDNGASNVLIEQCTFRWNNQFPLRSQVIDGYTLRNSVFEYNGGSGQDASFLTNSLFENNVTNFNNWRNFLGGATEWFLAGFKHQTNEGQIMRGHTSVGNLAAGCWWDISNKDQFISGITSVLNYREGFFYEISEGPVVLEKSLIALNALEGSSNFRNTSGVQTTFRNNIIYSNVPYRDANGVAVIDTLARQGNFRTTMYPRGQPGAPPELGLGVDEAEVRTAKMTSFNNVIMGGEQEGFIWYFSENNNEGQNFVISDYQGKGNYFYHASGSSEGHFRAGAFDDAPIRNYEGYVAWAGEAETNSRFTDPGFTDPDNLDFRLSADSPLKGQESDYLATAVDPQLVARCQAFWDWVGYERTVPGGSQSDCLVQGGTLRGGPFEFAVDGQPDFVSELSLNAASGASSTYVITDADGNILGLPPTLKAVEEVNFDEAGAGVCLIWHLSFEGSLLNAAPGNNASQLEGCFELSNPIQVTRLGGDAPSSEGAVVIRAQGDCGDEVMVLQVDGQEVDRWTVSTTAADYTYPGFSGGQVAVLFVNDRYQDGGTCEDSNLSVDFIQVCGTTYQTEAVATVTADCCPGVKDKLYTNGNFNYGTLSCASSRAPAVGSLGQGLVDKEVFTSYPNPVSEAITVEGSADYRVTVYDLMGQAVMHHEHLRHRVRLDVSHLRPGVYLMKVRDAVHQKEQRIIIE